MTITKKPTDYFDDDLAALLAGKISRVDKIFDGNKFIQAVSGYSGAY